MAAGATDNRFINYIEVDADGSIIVQLSQNVSNPDHCQNANRIYISPNNVYIDRFYAAALAAYSNGKHVWAWVSGCQLMGWGEEYPRVVNFAIAN